MQGIKKVFAFCLVMVMLLGIVTACSKTDKPATQTQTETPKTQATDTGKTQTQEPAKETTQEQEVYTLKLCSEFAPEHVFAQTFYAMSDEMKERSNGRLILQYYPNNQLGTESELWQAVTVDAHDMLTVGAGVCATTFPLISVLNAPYLFRDYDHAMKVFNGPIAQEIFDRMAEACNGRIVGALYAGYRHSFTVKTPIEKVEDFKGLKLRVPEQPILIDLFNAFGASAMPMDFGEVYLALQQGVLDAAEQPASFYVAGKWQDVTKYMCKTAHVCEVAMVCISEAKYKALPDDLRELFDECMEKYCKQASETVYSEEEAQIQWLIDDCGIICSEPDLEPFRKIVVENVLPKYSGDWEDYYERISAVK